MEGNGVIIKKLSYENIGNVLSWQKEFWENTAWVQDEHMDVTLRVLRLLLGEGNACEGHIQENSKVDAQVQAGDDAYFLAVTFHSGTPEFTVTDGADRRRHFVQAGEQVCFESLTWQEEMHPMSFAPQILLPGKDYWLCKNEDGKACVRQGLWGEEVPCMSETETHVFRYLCFLQQVQENPEIRLPLVIRDFGDRVDESVDMERLYALAAAKNRQIIILKG